MPSCVFRRCTNYTATTRGKNISFHALPRDGLLKEKWLKVIRTQRREDDWIPSKHSRVCSEHFLESDKYRTEKRNIRKIKKSAVPVIEKEPNVLLSPSSLQHVYLSDEESIFETPRKSFLKSKIRRITQEKRKLQFKNYNLTRKNKRLKQKFSNLKQIVSELKSKQIVTIDQLNELECKAEAVEFTNRFIEKTKFKGYRPKYTPALRKFAVTLHYYSAAAYKYVRQIFNGSLPHPRIIGKWYENTSGEPGFNKQALNVLEQKYKLSGQRILCTLVVDEMALRHQTIWTGKQTGGLVDFGVGTLKTCEIATQAYVFLLVCMNESWKIPVAYFLVNSLSAETRANLLRTCLSECYEVGVDIVAVTFDGCSSNITAAKLLGCNFDNLEKLKTNFTHPNTNRFEVAIILDPCHMIKLVRNNFESKRLIFNRNGQKIKWQFLINLVKLQKNIGLNFGNKLTERHITFRNEIMKVRLATQIFSMSVANALKLCSEILTSSLFVDSEPTIEFITIFNNLFDVFNSKAHNFYGFKKPISPKNADEIIEYLEKVKQYILGLNIFVKYRRNVDRHITMKVMKKRVVESQIKTGFLGFLICIESLKHLYSTLVVSERLNYIATYRLSQDHLEMLFGTIRRHGGYNNNPNAIQFKGIFKKILQHLEMRSSFLGNCIPLEDLPILQCSSAVDNINSSVDRRAIDDECDSVQQNVDHDIDHNYQNVEIFSEILNSERIKKVTEQIIGYIAGWVARKLVRVLRCEKCVDSLISNEKLWFHKMITIKDMGGLCFPSEDVFRICLKSEAIIKNHIKEKGHIILPEPTDIEIIKTQILKSFIHCDDVFGSLHFHTLDQDPTLNHRLHLIRAIIESYIKVRLHFTHKNTNIKNDYKRQQRNKLSLFEGI